MFDAVEPVVATKSGSPVRPLPGGAIKCVVLAVLLTAAGLYQAAHLTALSDADIWSHLRAGTWMLEHHAVPRTGLFSQSPALPWIDSTWGFDLLVATAWKILGLKSLPVLLMVLQTAAAAALFQLAAGPRATFWPAAILVAVAQCCLAGSHSDPKLISIFFLALELALLFRARQSGQTQTLLWLPLLFLAWANLDRQFVYGLMALALFFLTDIVERAARGSERPWIIDRENFERILARPPFRLSAAIFAASLLATLITPYTWRLHQLLWRGTTSTAVDRYLPEFHSMRFRQAQDYLLMLLVMAAFLALGRRHSRDIFQISLLVIAAIISFRLQRDVWLVTVVAVGILGQPFVAHEAETSGELVPPRAPWQPAFTAALVLAVLAAASLHFPASGSLMAKVAGTFPVRASDYIRLNHLPQPLFNTYAWGSFLTWYLPEYPVVMDSRLDLYGDAVSIPYFQLTLAEIPLESHPGFAQAQTFLFEAKSPIGEALATLSNFSVAYRDDQAYVLVRRN